MSVWCECNKKALVIPMILEAFGGITSLFTLHPAPRATGEGGARAHYEFKDHRDNP